MSNKCCFNGLCEGNVPGVEMRYDCNDDTGRSLWTTQDITVGTVIFGNEPVSCVLSSDYIEDRCSFCFSTREGQNGLNKCGKCKFARYCDTACQRADWAQHKNECVALSKTIGRQSLLEICQNDGPGVINDIRLLLRVVPFLISQPQISATSDTVPHECNWTEQDSSPLIKCCSHHLKDMYQPEFNLDYSTTIEHRKIVELASHFLNARMSKAKLTPPSEHDLSCILLKFRANNFGITDSLLQCIGAGVYPAVALLNHSCKPSCILRYVIARGRSVTLQVVAGGCNGNFSTVGSNKELSHSYVDLGQPTRLRQEKLKLAYNFECRCDRCCTSECYSFLCDNCAESGSLEEEIKLAVKFEGNQLNAHCESKRKKLNVEIAIAFEIERSAPMAIAKAAQYQRLAAVESLDQYDEPIGALKEIQYLIYARDELVTAVGPFHSELYKVHGQLLTACLVTGDTVMALHYCFKVVGYLYLTFCDVPWHPLLGLQLFTLGDLLAMQEDRQADAAYVYTWSHRILKIAYGRDNDLVHRLETSMKEVGGC